MSLAPRVGCRLTTIHLICPTGRRCPWTPRRGAFSWTKRGCGVSPGFGKRSQVTKNVGGERSPEPQSLYARRAHPTATLQPRRHAPLRPPPRSRRPGRDLATLQPRRLTPPHALIATATLQPRRHAPLRPPPRSRRPGRDLASSPAAARTHLAAAHDPHRHRAPTLATHPTADPRHDDLASSPAAARTHLAAAHDPHRHRAPTLATHPTADPRHDDLAPTLHPKNSRSYARLRFLTGPYLRRAAFSHWARFLPCFLWQAFSAAASFCAFVLVLGQPVTEIGVF